MSAGTWRKAHELVKLRENARYKPSPFLDVRIGARKTSFRVNFRQDGIELRETLKGKFTSIDDWEAASREAERLIGLAKYGEKEQPKDLMRSEDLCQQLLDEAQAQDDKTIAEKTNTFKNHLIPWLNEHVPYAADFNVTTWPRYKSFARAKDPTIALENHAKRFRTLFKRAFELGIVKQKISLIYNIAKEEFREEGLVIPDTDIQAMLKVAKGLKNQAWYIRILLGRFTGMRPGEARDLRKKPVPHPRDKSQSLPANVEFVRRKAPRSQEELDAAKFLEMADRMGGLVPADTLKKLRDALEAMRAKESPETDVAIIRFFEEDTKTHRYREFEILAQPIVQALKAQVEDERYLASPYVFPMKEDLSRPTDKHLGVWRNIRRDAGVNDSYTPHDLRHTYATEMFAKTNEWAKLSYQLDMSLEIAQKVYLHFEAKDTTSLAAAAGSSAVLTEVT